MIAERRKSFLDRFTQVDDILQQILVQMIEINQNLKQLTKSAITQEKTRVQEKISKEEKEIQEILAKYGITRKEEVEHVIPVISFANINVIPTISSPVDIVRVDKLDVSYDEDSEVVFAPETNVIIIYSNTDIYFGKDRTTVTQPFFLTATSYFMMNKSSGIQKMYFRSAVGTGTVYILELKYSS